MLLHSLPPLFYTALSDFSNALANLVTTNATVATSLSNFNSTYFNFFNMTIQQLSSLGFPNSPPQISRVKCQTEILKIAASLKCLACDPNYGTKGVASDGTVSFSARTCTRMSFACTNYVLSSYNYSQFFILNASINWLNTATNQMNQIQNGTATNITLAALPTQPQTNDITDYSIKHSTCSNSTYCDYVCLDGGFIKKGVLDAGALVLGGELQTGIFNRRLLQEYDDIERSLQQSTGAGGGAGSGLFDPDENESGVLVILAKPSTNQGSGANILHASMLLLMMITIFWTF